MVDSFARAGARFMDYVDDNDDDAADADNVDNDNDNNDGRDWFGRYCSISALRLRCSIVSFTELNTTLMLRVSMAVVKWW